ncbi:endonuclease/exonuclease/phosphatase family protein [uncultured Sunxiuqinia sp.]|uniref:endonuclease/exonuclease/phosphatase family protein n=1 Tax=uncultured Sunxiuqinia sp. TaxID=1573825 RepID=UPI002614725F|nr:endonuclease/exonuclease/phosphatase family protein [uncultured Sunxiuqinia sp.]
MKNKSFLFTVFFTLSISLFAWSTNKKSLPSIATKQAIRVMTYNIHHANPPGEAGVIDLDAIAQVIRDSKADLIAVQELDSAAERSQNQFQLEILAQKLDMNFHFFRSIPLGEGSYGVGVLSRFPISQAQTIKLPEQAEHDAEDRVLGLVLVQLSDEQKIYFASTHWDYKHLENRLLQAEKTNTIASQLDAPLIIGGDFNDVTESKPMDVLREVFTDASKEFALTIPTVNPKKRIDHILYTNPKRFKIGSEAVITSPLAQKASDHLPYWVDLVIAD